MAVRMSKVSSNASTDPVSAESGFLKFCKDNYNMMQWVCFIGIILCYSYYAHLQEVLLGNKQLKLSVSLVLCFQYLIAMLVAFVIIAASGKTSELMDAFSYDDFVVAVFNFGSMNFSNKAMSLVSYPFVVLSKSAKIIPVILVGTLRGVYKPKP